MRANQVTWSRWDFLFFQPPDFSSPPVTWWWPSRLQVTTHFTSSGRRSNFWSIRFFKLNAPFLPISLVQPALPSVHPHGSRWHPVSNDQHAGAEAAGHLAQVDTLQYTYYILYITISHVIQPRAEHIFFYNDGKQRKSATSLTGFQVWLTILLMFNYISQSVDALFLL